MRRLGLVIAVLIIFAGVKPASAQYFYMAQEYGLTVGGSQYFGDLNENYGFKSIHPAEGVFFRLHLNPYISVKAVANFTQVGYDDSYNKDPFDKERNLSFRSNIFELAAQAEFNFFRFETGNKEHRFTPYLTGGIGAFYYDPYTFLDGKKYYLRPLGTEGQNAGYPGRKYSSIAACFPVGAGVKYWVRPGMNIGGEIVDRLTTTDYLDDVSTTYVGADKFAPGSAAYYLQDRSNPDSPLGRAGKQRGNASTKDQYLMFVFQISFQFKTYRCPSYLSRGFVPTR